jgi:actin-related protein 5
MPIHITRADDPSLDAWKGMASFASKQTEELQKISITRSEYDEQGGERVKRWWGGNWNASVL